MPSMLRETVIKQTVNHDLYVDKKSVSINKGEFINVI